jgi:signal transduction histidine kinase
VVFEACVYKLPLSTEMKLPDDSRTICAGLDQFCLPSALFARTTDRFVGWNKSFMEATGLSTDEISVVPVSEILRMETPTAETNECEAGAAPVHPEKCILKAASDDQPITAKLFEREDGYSLLIVDGNAADQSNEDFIRGLLIGKTEEQDRIRQKFHDDVAPQIMAAAFATEVLAERVRQGANQDAEELKRIADLISDLVGGIRNSLGNRGSGN